MKLIKLIKNLFKKPSVYDELMQIRKTNEVKYSHPIETREITIDLNKYLYPTKQFKKLSYNKSELITKVPRYVQFEKLGLAQEILDKNKYYYMLSSITHDIKSIKMYEEWLLSGSSPENCFLLEKYNNIFEASNKSDLFGIMYYLYYGASINAKDESGNTLLSNAISKADLGIMIYCLAYKAELPTIMPNFAIFEELDDNLEHITRDITLQEYVSRNQKLITCDYLLYHKYVDLQKIEVKEKKLITKKSTKEEDLITLKHFAYWAEYAYDRSISIYNLYKKEEQDNQSGKSDKKNYLNYQTRYAQDNDFRLECPTYESYLDNLSSNMNSIYDISLKDIARSQEKLNNAKKRLEDKYSFCFNENSTYVELIAQFKQILELKDR